MRFLLTSAIALVALCGPLGAQQLPGGFPPGAFSNKAALEPSGGAPPSYTGPGDVVTSSVWVGYWSLRAFSAATAGTKAANVCNPTNQCQDFLTDATTGKLVLATIMGTDCTVSTCTINTLYDQTGNGDDLNQGTQANRPTLVTSCIGSLPCMACSGSQNMILTGWGNPGQPFATSAVVNRTGNTTAFSDWLGSSSGGTAQSLFLNSANTVGAYAGNITTGVTANDNAWHGVNINYNGASSQIQVDGTTTSSLNVGANTFNNEIDLCWGNNFLTGSVAEASFHAAAGFTGTELTNLYNNMHAFYGVF